MEGTHPIRLARKAILAVVTAGLFSAVYSQDRALLFEISGNGLSQPSYLFGTFHLLCAHDLQLTETTRGVLNRTEQLYLELDMDDPALLAGMVLAMRFSGGQELQDFLTPEDYATLDTYLQENLGSGLARTGSLKPIALLSPMLGSILKCQPASYDLTLAQLAVREGKEVFGLETPEEQIAMLDSVPVAEQLEGLVEMAKNPGQARAEIMNLIAAYKAQDLPLLMTRINDSKFGGGIEGRQEELLDGRNRRWVPIIEQAAREKATLFAFGAGHLGGTNGVIPLLRQKGYTITAIN